MKDSKVEKVYEQIVYNCSGVQPRDTVKGDYKIAKGIRYTPLKDALACVDNQRRLLDTLAHPFAMGKSYDEPFTPNEMQDLRTRLKLQEDHYRRLLKIHIEKRKEKKNG